jgi:hypothetical protein
MTFMAKSSEIEINGAVIRAQLLASSPTQTPAKTPVCECGVCCRGLREHSEVQFRSMREQTSYDGNFFPPHGLLSMLFLHAEFDEQQDRNCKKLDCEICYDTASDAAIPARSS